MKKSILFTALVALLVATSCASSTEQTGNQKPKAPKREGWNDGPLYGDVESVTITEYDLAEKFGEIVKDKMKNKATYKFNLNGDVVEIAYYNSDGSLRWKELYKYDAQGKKIEEAEYYPDGSLSRKETYKYDSQGNKIEWTWYNFDGSLSSKTIYKYDSQGNEIEMAVIDEFEFEHKNYVVGALIENETVNEDGLFIFKLKEAGDEIKVEKITSQVDYQKIAQAYMEMDN